MKSTSIEKLIYITDSRLPTEKAHGYQICKMCEAFSQIGLKVKLIHPLRKQYDQRLNSYNIYDFYGIKRNFEILTLKNIDLIPVLKYLPSKISPFVVSFNYFLWSKYAVETSKKEKADIYYTRSLFVAHFLDKHGLPFILELHTIPKGIRLFFLKKLRKSQNMIKIAPITKQMANILKDLGYQEEKIVVLPDGVDLELFKNVPDKLECRHKLNLPREAIIIGYIGRFKTMNMDKGIGDLIKALSFLPNKIDEKPVYLLCVGGPMEVVSSYMQIAKQVGVPANRLLFFDRVHPKEVPYWIKACDVLTVTFPFKKHYAYYASPLKLFEYMASGVPIVSSDLPSIREILKDKEHCMFFKPGNPKDLAEKILMLIKDKSLYNKMSKNLIKEVNKYSWINRCYNILS